MAAQETLIENFRLSPQQRHLCAIQGRGQPFPFHAYTVASIQGRFSLSRFRAALKQLVERYEILRTDFPYLPEQRLPVQVINTEISLPLAVYDYRAVTPQEREKTLLHLREAMLEHPYTLGEERMWRMALAICEDGHHILLCDLSVLCADTKTCQVLLHELSQLYARGANEETAETLQYADLAEWQYELLESVDTQEGRAHWHSLEHDVLKEVSLPYELHADHPSPFTHSSLSINISPGEQTQLQSTAQRLVVSPSAVFLTCWGLVLSRLSGQSSLPISSAFSGRVYEELSSAVGLLTKFLPLPFQFREDARLSDTVRRVEAMLQEASKWQPYFDWSLFEAHKEQEPFAAFGFSYEALPAPWQTGSLRWSIEEQEACLERFDVSLSVLESSQGFMATLHYDAEKFASENMRRLLAQWQMIFQQVLVSSEATPASLQLLTHEEQQQILAWNATQEDYPAEAGVHQLFEQQVQRTPDAIALIFGEEALTYDALNRRANQLAHSLRRRGVGPETLVGLYLERSLTLVIGLLGVLKAGGAYVPLDPSYPQERLAFLLHDADIALLLTSQSLSQYLPEVPCQVVYLDALENGFTTESCTNILDRGSAERLAYVLYTSGSTGHPKGVMVPHAALTNYLSWATRTYGSPADSGGSGAPLHSPLSFDLTVTSLFVPLLSGQKVVLLAEETGIAALGSALDARNRFMLTKVTPAHLEALSEVVTRYHLAESTQALVIGGEALWQESLASWRTFAPGTRLINEYGPTETVVGCCVYEVPPQAPASGAVPIGKPIANTQLYVLDQYWQQVPMGVAAELYVGGVGVTRGYLKRPDLTAERFIPHPFSSEHGARLYRTGDRVRYLPDGNLEYLGRVDQQVKIRGYRIEPGEIETVLRQHAAVKDAVVLAREDQPGVKQLVAYVVLQQRQTLRSANLRVYLQDLLPSYMIPAIFVPLATLPLTSNGKVDRQALPSPRGTRSELAETFVAPTNDVEMKLAATWSQLLGVEGVGTHDNFFALGGDSILSIQMVSRARQMGLYLIPRQLFQHQTIADLARVVTSTTSRPSTPALISGPAPLTPIQRWFFSRHLPVPEHFNQAVLLATPSPVRLDWLDLALRALVVQHDALRLRFTSQGDGWQQEVAPTPTTYPALFIDLSALPQSQQSQAQLAVAEAAQAHMDLHAGLLLRALCFLRGHADADQLLLIIHHLGVDGVSWRILFDDLESAYGHLAQGKPLHLPANTTSWQDWALLLEQYASSASLLAEQSYWLTPGHLALPPLPQDGDGKDNTLASQATISVALSVEQTRALLQEVPAAYHTRIHEVLLTALAQAFAHWTGSPRLLIDLEGHGREEDVIEGVDLTRTVGWFTILFPVLLQIPTTADTAGAIKAVKEQLRQIPHNGSGYGALRYLSQDEAVKAAFARQPQAQVLFNYLGQFDASFTPDSLFIPTGGPTGAVRSPQETPDHVFEIMASVIEERLQVNWQYSQARHRPETIQRLAQDFLEALTTLITHCQSPQAGGYTPSDFPLVSLTPSQLDMLIHQIPQAQPGRPGQAIEEIAPLSPMQAGLWFHSRYDPTTAAYWIHTQWIIQGSLNMEAWHGAWREIIQRHSLLRTLFVEYEGQSTQIVLRQVDAPCELLDWRDLSPEVQQLQLQELAQNTQLRSQDLGTAPLLRVVLVRLQEKRFAFHLSIHHLIVDGWSQSLLLAEVYTCYEALCQGEAPTLPPARPYRDYLAWLAQRDPGQAEQFWQTYLRGVHTATPLPGGTEAVRRPWPQVALQQIMCSQEFSETLTVGAQQLHVTLNTLVQGAWALLLSRYSGEHDVLFGATTTGRTAELAGVETMVGVFINTLPVRVRLPQEQTVGAWLAELQDEQAEARQYESTPLVQIQGWSAVPGGQPLFESLLLFQNYPEATAALEASPEISVQVTANREQTHYPLMLKAMLARGALHLSLQYDEARFEPELIERLLRQLQLVLRAFVEQPAQPLGQISLLSPEEQRQLAARTTTQADYPAAMDFLQLFERQVRRTPDAVALLSEDQHLTYAALHHCTTRLAATLHNQDAGPEILVGLCLERSLPMVIALIAVLQAGAAYVPLDPTYPQKRLTFLLHDAQPALLLTQQSLRHLLPPSQAHTLVWEQLWPLPQYPAAAQVGSLLSRDQLAYLIYTSGSTGQPKGVLLSHRGLGNLARNQATAFAQGPGCRVLQFASLNFDASIWEITMSLLSGACLHMAPSQQLLPGPELFQFLREQAITTVTLPPSALAVLPPDPLPALQTLIVAGEPCSVELMTRWAPGRRFFNAYGPTEATVCASMAPCSIEPLPRRSLNLGQSLEGTWLLLLDEAMQPVPMGAIGEIYLGGVNLARGYRHLPAQTAERFVPHPSSPEPGTRLYRTGDLARYASDGSLEFVGRVDQQVKIWGHRIELGEIETVLRQQAEVQEAVVLAREEQSGDKRLVAYVVGQPEQPLNSSALRASLQDRLPSYMLPAALVVLETLPLTLNGKVDRRALPDPAELQEEEEPGVQEATTPMEALLAGLWSEILDTPVGRYDNFFELGGHSLLAGHLVGQVRQLLQVEVPARTIFEAPTLAAFALQVEQALQEVQKRTMPPLVAEPRPQVLPLSFAQQRLWFLDQLEPESLAYLIPLALHVNGALEARSLERGISALIERHESLRTTFGEHEGLPIQLIHPAGPWALPIIDLHGLEPAQREQQARRLASQEAQHPARLQQGPLFRATLLRLNSDEHVLLLTLHHIITDGWSNEVLVRDLTTFYRSFVAGEPSSLAPLPIQYADYTLWQRAWLQGAVLEEQLAYWQKQLAASVPLALPTDHPRPAVRTFRGASQAFQLSPHITGQLQALSQQEQTTLFMTLLASFQVLLSRYSGQDDISVGTPIANRQHAGLKDVIGFFINTLVLRGDLSGNPSFAEILRRVREVCLGAYAHQDVPFEQIVEALEPERDMSHAPLFQVMFSLQNVPQELVEVTGIRVSLWDVEHIVSKFDLTMTLEETKYGLVGTLVYNTDLFEQETIARLLQHWHNLLEGIIEQPQAPISHISLLSAQERERILTQWNTTLPSRPAEVAVHHLFEQQAQRAPDAIALVFQDHQLTYGALNRRTNQLAHYLQRLGVGPEELVGLCLERSLEMVIGLLGILKAGGAYVPIDPTSPPERLNFILADTRVAVVITQERWGELCAATGKQLVILDDKGASFAVEDEVNPASRIRPENRAYVIYTSGSTGRPKGVLIEHSELSYYVSAVMQLLGLDVSRSAAMVQPLEVDSSVTVLYATLCTGGRLHIITKEQAIDPDGLGRYFLCNPVDLLKIAPSHLAALLHAGAPHHILPRQWLIIGGEAARPEWVQKLWAFAPHCTIFNHYGPTEATVGVLVHRVRNGDNPHTLPLGRPLPGAEVYILDEHLHPVPAGVAGELYLGGICLARGYLDRPDLTADSFVPHPFSSLPGKRLYKTGDRVCFLPGGNIEYLGRLDEQAKIRGYRIEPGEIEAALATHPGVQESLVLAREEEAGDKRLVAYIVERLGAALDDRALRASLQERLPSFMLPEAYVFLQALPLTPHGKVDRRALPPPAVREDGQYATRIDDNWTPVEELLAGLWSTVLGNRHIAPHDNFFEQGGHSLLATQLIGRVRQTFAVEVPLRAIFEAPILSAFARLVEQAMLQGVAPARPPLVARTRPEALPLSFAQQRLWFLNQLEPGSVAYLIPLALRIEGTLQAHSLERSIAALIERHESLRTTFGEHAGQPVQLIHPAGPWLLPIIDLQGLQPGQREQLAQRLASQEAQRPVDLTQGPLLRVMLLQTQRDEHILLLTLHHIITDAWSNEVLVRDLTTLYRSFVAGEPLPLAPLPVQYADYTLWQHAWLQGTVLEEQLAYWQEQLAEASPLALPTDHPHPPLQTFRGARQWRQLSQDLSQQLHQLSQQEHVTLFMTLLASFQVLLARYSDQDDISVGTPIANRWNAGQENMIGFFMNTLVLRANLSGNPGFVEVLRRVREICLGAYAHQDVPFEQIVEAIEPERDLSRSPLFQVMFSLQNMPQDQQAVAGIRVSPLEVESVTSKFELFLGVNETPHGLHAMLEYNTDLFEAETIDRLLDHWQQLLEGMVNEPHRPIAALPLLSAVEYQQLVAWNATEAPRQKGIHQFVEQQTLCTPDAIALVFEEQHLTYDTLNRRANQLAHLLLDQGVGPDSLVGLCLRPSPEMLLALLGILKAGAAYVPFDPSLPPQRLHAMLQEARVTSMLTQHTLTEVFMEHMETQPLSLLCLDRLQAKLEQQPVSNPSVDCSPDDLAYVLYTSGSTGQPKGVMLPHRALLNLFTWQARTLPLHVGTRVLQFTSLSFDVSCQEIFTTWHSGGTLVLLPDEQARRAPHALLDLLTRQRMERLFVPYVALQQLALAAEHDTHLELILQDLITAGEQLQMTPAITAWIQRLPGCTLSNHYGPTESHVVTAHELHGDPRAWPLLPPIGHPVSNTQIYLLDAHLQPVPVGVVADLYIGGAPLARGYLHRPDLSAERFIPHPLTVEPGQRLYKTGDRARYRSDGAIEYLGRSDGQVKLRGFRVELGEVEAVLATYPAIQECAVVLREDLPGEKRLVAYVVARPGHTLNSSALLAWLREYVPTYMLPAAFVQLEAMPLTTSGKLHRRALPAPAAMPEDGDRQRPETPIEELLVSLWSQLLGGRQVGRHDNFFEVGGHSLLATRLIGHVRQTFAVEVPLRTIFEVPILSAFARQVEQAMRQGEAPTQQPLVAGPRSAMLPLSFAQQRLWFLDQFEPGSTAYLIPLAFRVAGTLEARSLERSIETVVQRHESLRTTFGEHQGQLVQVIHPATPHILPVIDLQGLEPGPREQQTHRLVSQEAQRPMDLAQGPLLRSALLRLLPSEHALLLTLHHIVTDAWSNEIMIRELTAVYHTSVADASSSLPPLLMQYADYALWQRTWLQGPMLEEQLAYWRGQLEGAMPLALSTDHPRPPIQTFHGASQAFHVSEFVTGQLQALSQQERTTLFMTLLASFQVLLARHSGQSDISVGTDIANRRHSELDDVIGFFVNTLVLRTDLSGNPGFIEVLQRVREVCLGAYVHQDISFEQVVEALEPERDLSRTPLFQVMFSMQNMPQEQATMSGIQVSALDVEKATSKFDLTLNVQETPYGLYGTLEYNTDLFEAATIERMLEHWQNLLQGIIATPQAPILSLPLLSDTERRWLLHDWNATATALPEASVPLLIAARARRHPDTVAAVCGEAMLTYGALEQAASALAGRLAAVGVGPDVLVALYMERSLAMLVTILAVFKAGGAYLPLDPAYPEQHLAFILQDARVTVLVTQTEWKGRIPPTIPTLICLDRDWSAIMRDALEPAPLSNHVSQLAYVIYTSGSTGHPKGVMVTMDGMLNHLIAKIETLQLDATDRMAQTASQCFDISVWQFLAALLQGGQVSILVDEIAHDPEQLGAYVARQSLSIVEVVPSLLRALLEIDSNQEMSEHVRWLLVTGEALSGELCRSWGQRAPTVPLVNAYGPTECSDDVTHALILAGEVREGSSVPIGRPIVNTQIYIVDAQQDIVPIGVPGEIYVGGRGVGRGYLGQPTRTASAFLPDPFSQEAGARWYRTGDIGRYLADGQIEFLGRRDQQIKIHGYRIELGEIEGVLDELPQVKAGIVLAREDQPGVKRLVAYIVQQPGENLASQYLRATLQERLPAYMIPSAFVFLDALLLTPNGKIDRDALPAPEQPGAQEATGFLAPRTAVEKALAVIWAEVLGLQHVGIRDNFFELGGDSIISIQIIARARQKGLHITLKQLFQYPTIEELSLTASEDTLVQAEQGPVLGEVPLTPIQHDFFDLRLPARHHWNQAQFFEIAERLEHSFFEEILRLWLQHHDALRLRFTPHHGEWRQYIADVEDTPPFLVVDLSQLGAAEQREMALQHAAQAQASLDIVHGPLMRMIVFDMGKEHAQWILIIIHHLAIDGVSWRILLEDLESAHRQVKRGQQIELPAKTSSFKAWAQHLVAYAQSSALQQEWEYWRTVIPTQAPSLPLDFPSHTRGNTVASERTVLASLTIEETRALLEDLPAIYHTRVNDILVTALAQAFADWTGSQSLLLAMEGHGREDLFDDMDISRTVGWFTSGFPVHVCLGENRSLAETIQAVKEQLHALPNHGIGYGILRYLSPDDAVMKDLQERSQAEVSFNYLGQFNQAAPLLRRALPAGLLHDARGERTHLLDINCNVSDHQFRVAWSYSDQLHRHATIESLATAFMQALRAIINHAEAHGGDDAFTASFPNVELSQEQLEQIVLEMDLD